MPKKDESFLDKSKKDPFFIHILFIGTCLFCPGIDPNQIGQLFTTYNNMSRLRKTKRSL